MELLIDIGGTKTSSAVLSEDGTIMWSQTEKTQKGIPNFTQMIEEIAKKAPQPHHIKIAIPGKLIGPNKDTIAPGTGTQLASYPNEFDNLNLTKLLAPRFPNHTLFFINDAIAQFIGGLLQIGLHHFKNKTVGYIGPGTGLGGGFATIDENETIHIITDGHIFDILVTENAQAEDILSGRGIQEKTHLSGEEINTLSHPKFKETAQTLGNTLATLIEKIVTGTIRKKNPKNNWPQSDIDAVKNTKHFIIGGSIGTKPPLSSEIITIAEKKLTEKKIDPVHLHPIPNQTEAAWQGLHHQHR